MEIIYQKPYAFTLSKNANNQLVLSVLCGTVGLFEINIILNEQETQAYHNNGNSYIEQLATQLPKTLTTG